MQRLVVVADNSLILEAIAVGLRQSGEFKLLGHLDVRGASTRAIIEAQPDVVLVDDDDESELILDLIRRLKAEQPRIAVIVLTMAMDPERLGRIFDAGANGAIAKTTHPAALATLVRETVSGHIVHRYRAVETAAIRPPQPAATDDASLTTRELEVLRLVADGSTNGEIARNLWVTEQTVKFHLSNVYRKLDVGNRTEASHYAHVHGLLAAAPALATCRSVDLGPSEALRLSMAAGRAGS